MGLVTRAKLFLARRLCQVAHQCVRAEDYGHAILSYQLARRLIPDDEGAYLDLVNLLYEVQDLRGCILLVTEWLNCHPADFKSRVRAAWLYTQERDWGK